MELGYKHFSHTHKLEMHEMPEGAEVSCSGCNSSANKTIYACWQCNFFLHEQCFLATRSKKHPSHPLHPLTLVPYPTYISNSFYCNNCKIIGTGFSYSCSDCDFDLHVQCAYSISDSTSAHLPNMVNSPYLHNNSYQNQEIVPQHFHGQSSSMVPNIVELSTPFPTPNHQAPAVYAQYPAIVNQDPYMGQNLSHISFLPSAQNPTASPQAYASQNLLNIPPSAQNSSFSPYPTNLTQDSYMAQNGPFTSINPTTSAHNMYTSQNFANIPTSAHSSSIPQYPASITQDSNMMHNVSQSPVPGISQSPNTTPQKVYASQNYMTVPTNTTDHNTSPSAPYEKASHYEESGPKIAMNQEIKHFSHPHGLVLVNIKPGKKKKICSGCQETLVGKGYACVEENCGFQLDESCFNLEKEIWHKSHPAHPLSLLSSSPYKNANGMFACGACFKNGSGFTYHCSICEYDLDVKCANLRETVKRDDHQHLLKLYYKCPLKGEDYTFYCDVCNRVVLQDHWTYYCKDCDYGTHLDCVDREESDDLGGDPNADERTNELTLAETIEIARISALGRKYALDLI
ncbi:zinc finger, PHD-type, C1-like protein [Artemisia annua]|uniref:Zinc finger, PHD-type, C1-like protein n=1 Tax=Artemisia annua TaxID=35608 RepID=A0A2U1Q5U3_ARTAN|nr:zinc finger, PHD-type, C1-like protein [Artemisia annua]